MVRKIDHLKPIAHFTLQIGCYGHDGIGGNSCCCSILTIRHIGLSREGTITLSWPTENESPKNDFEVSQWHERFLGVFLVLAQHVQGGMKEDKFDCNPSQRDLLC